MSNYFLGQGKVYQVKRTGAGAASQQRWLLDVSELKISLSTETKSKRENHSGQMGLAKRTPISNEASVSFVMEELSKENLALALRGTASEIASGSITAEALPDGLLAEDRVSLKYMKVSAVTITDSSATPLTIDPSHYTVDETYGAIKFSDVTGTQPFKVAYTHAAVDSVAMFSAAAEDIGIRYEGINLAENGAPIIVELYKVSTEPLKELSLINADYAGMSINAAVLLDDAKTAGGELGQFGRILQPA